MIQQVGQCERLRVQHAEELQRRVFKLSHDREVGTATDTLQFYLDDR